MGKILIDLRNTREEALSVAEPKSGQNEAPFDSKTINEPTLEKRPHDNNQDVRRPDENSMSQEDDEDKETKYRLDPKSVVYLFLLFFFFFLGKVRTF